MNFEEKKRIESIEVTIDGTLIVKEIISYYKDSILLTQKENRFALSPASDLTGQDPFVIKMANATWTEDIVNNFLSSSIPLSSSTTIQETN